VSPNVEKLVFAVVIYDAVERHEHFGNVAHTSIKFTAEGHGLLDEHRLAGNFAKFTGVVVGEVHREANHWAFQSIDKGYYGGLSEIGTLYGVHFRDTPPA
jgi:tellurium resistance protein TerD